MKYKHAILLVGITAGCDATVQEHKILTGWNVDWEQLSHRVSYLETTLEPDALHFGMIGGDWSTGEAFSDMPTYRARYDKITSKAAHFLDGETELVIGPEGATSAEVTVSKDALPRHGKQVVIIRGFSYNTDTPGLTGYPEDYDPSHGYTLLSQGVALSEVRREAGNYVFDVQAIFEAGSSDREDMNGALPYVQVEATVAWTLVSFNGNLDIARLYETQEMAWTPPYSTHEPFFEGLPLEFDSRHETGITGWRAFVLSQENEAEHGEYIRTMGSEIVPKEAGAVSQGFTGNVEAIYSNSSLSEYHQIDMGFEGEVVWMGLADSDATLSRHVVEVEAETLGSIEAGLPELY